MRVRVVSQSPKRRIETLISVISVVKGKNVTMCKSLACRLFACRPCQLHEVDSTRVTGAFGNVRTPLSPGVPKVGYPFCGVLTRTTRLYVNVRCFSVIFSVITGWHQPRVIPRVEKLDTKISVTASVWLFVLDVAMEDFSLSLPRFHSAFNR